MTRLWIGTASVTNGDATVVLTGDTLTDANCPADAPITLGGVGYHVLSRTNTTTVELTRNYAGSTADPVVAEIDPLTPDALSVVNVAVMVARVQAQLNVLDKNSQGLYYNRLGVTGAGDPGPGYFAVDDADPTLIENIWIDHVDANGLTVDGIVTLWTTGTILLIRSLTTTAYLALKLPGGVDDQTGYHSAVVQYVDHDGVLADDEPCSISYSRVGEGLHIDAAGLYADRGDFDDEAAGFVYLSTDGAAGSGPAVLYLKNSASTGDWSDAVAFQGSEGDTGWSPKFAAVSDGSRRVWQLVGYVGGTGSAPTADINKYVGPSGYTSDIGTAIDFRGATGATGAAGADGTNGADGAAGADGADGTNGTNGTNGTDGVDGVDGTDGVDGADGTDPGILLIWDEDNVDSDQGSGRIWADDDGLGAATTLYVSKTNRAGDDIESFLLSLDSVDSTVKGGITLTRSGGNAQATFDLFSVTDATGYVKLEIDTWSGATGFLQSDLISFQFARAGNKGTDGAGAGDVVGPGSAVSNNYVLFDGTTGKLIKDSGHAYGAYAAKASNGSDFSDTQAAFDNFSKKGADIASATTVNLDTATGSLVHITGTTPTTGFTFTSGRRRRLIADAAWPITAGANVVIEGTASASTYTCTAGDIIDIWQDGTTSRLTIHRISGKAVVAEVTLTGSETLTNKVLTAPQINDTSADHQYVVAVSELAADRTVTLPLLLGNDTFVFADFIQTLLNKSLVSMNGGQLAGFRNAVVNGGMMVAQLGTSFDSTTTPANSDDTYLLDQWILLSDGNDIVDVTRDTSVVPTGGLYALRADIETVNKKFGFFQPIQQKDCIGLIGNTVTLSFKAKVSATTKLDNLKAAIISWDGTADTITSDIVSAWGVEGTNPTLVANWTYENTPANLSPTTSYATYSVSAAVDTASTKNIGLFIWSDVTDTTLGDFLYITDVQLEIGSVATPFERRPYEVELGLCRWFGRQMTSSPTFSYIAQGQCYSTTSLFAGVQLMPPMRVTPAVIASAASGFEVEIPGGRVTLTAIALLTSGTPSPTGIVLNCTVASGLTAGQCCTLRNNNSATNSLFLDSRL